MPTCPRCDAEILPREKGSGLQRTWCSVRCRREAWREKNREHDLASKRKYAEAHREERKAYGLARYYEDKSRLLAYAKVQYQKTRLTSPWKVIFNSAKARATARRIPFDLTHEWMIARWTGCCELTDIPFVLGLPKGASRQLTASIDKIDAGKGYVQSNCRIILQSLNAFKGEGTDDEMLSIARALLSNAKVNTHRP